MENSCTEAELFLGLVVSAVLKYVASWWVRKRKDVLFEKVGHVSKLYIYPVKSCKALQLKNAECTKYGLKSNQIYDRGFVIIKPDGKFVHAREYSKMVLISVTETGDKLEFNASGKSPLSIPKQTKLDKNTIKRVEFDFNETMQCQDCGDEIATWINEFLGTQGFRLMRYVEGMELRDVHIQAFTWKTWDVATVEGDTSMYTDSSAYLMMNKASLDHLNTKLEKPLTELSFRPNILVEGPAAFDEDKWAEIKIGDRVRMRCTDECTRCSLTTVDPDTGAKARDGEPLKTLRKYRCFKQFGESPAFGINLAADVFGSIHVGDPVYAIRKR